MVAMIHNVPSHWDIAKWTWNHSTDKKVADNGSTEDNIPLNIKVPGWTDKIKG